jgi:hypothetical protein
MFGDLHSDAVKDVAVVEDAHLDVVEGHLGDVVAGAEHLDVLRDEAVAPSLSGVGADGFEIGEQVDGLAGLVEAAAKVEAVDVGRGFLATRQRGANPGGVSAGGNDLYLDVHVGVELHILTSDGLVGRSIVEINDDHADGALVGGLRRLRPDDVRCEERQQGDYAEPHGAA